MAFTQELDGISFHPVVRGINRLADENSWIIECEEFTFKRADFPLVTMVYSRTDSQGDTDTMKVEYVGGTVRAAHVSFMTHTISGYKARGAVEGILRAEP
ncbi:hypothetical protein SEA_GIBBLES_118 [Gordonia phage Gibbles]|uniref:Uncharacterized protein n=3 Tax=Gordonia phage Orchid TaxID=1838075 RepID=A0A160DJN5_9CAUD|nr:hypothetical protein BH761_gp098 [Gordonia phage Orchid]ANA87348.1 hypothetical protein PBI_PATRICKSTAR_116 [Gordonia phage PatrickStar]ANA87574.1 hypothetical protein PBI_KAMPE_116 [Gordonia phage Kampe]AXH46570.1 hypothetical protein SEA_ROBINSPARKLES_125 [Gordonia phage RobinSparkles]QDK02075.1 hypothetical protein SEA_GIBBLES_118 [Gordonia phage Gibbles]ANA87459.1 hypothetical protein PBI_ORCHID_115 [Gordonia phage Orchid]